MNNVLMENMIDWDKVILEEKEDKTTSAPTRKITDIRKIGGKSFRS